MSDPTTMSPRELAVFVKQTPNGELRRLMHSPRRTDVIDEIFTNMPQVFRADRAGALTAVIHWRIGDRPDGGVDVYEMVIADGACVSTPGNGRHPDLTLSLGGVDFLNLVTGNAHAVALVMRGRLKTKGDLALTAKFPTLFDPPRG
ncbi:SCP2 sterol-binding domain-containing protein [Micromonospora sp. NPDC050784]|uniref:SCP2 sterol-binding domain-containing protein n=1 Tax=Micromonospora sp. NPDC050784 TaxID=3364281 RepID=UPI00379B45C8